MEKNKLQKVFFIKKGIMWQIIITNVIVLFPIYMVFMNALIELIDSFSVQPFRATNFIPIIKILFGAVIYERIAFFVYLKKFPTKISFENEIVTFKYVTPWSSFKKKTTKIDFLDFRGVIKYKDSGLFLSTQAFKKQ